MRAIENRRGVAGMGAILLVCCMFLMLAAPASAFRGRKGDDADGLVTLSVNTSGGDTSGQGVTRNDKPGVPVPEPSSALLFGAGALVAAAAVRRRRDR